MELPATTTRSSHSKLMTATMLLLAVGMLAHSGKLFYRTFCDDRCERTWLFSADSLYPAAMYQDLVVDGFSWKGWQFSAATDFFPDFAIYFAARRITGSVASAMIVCTAVLYLLWVLAFLLVYRAVLPGDRLTGYLTLFGLSSFFLLHNAELFMDNSFSGRCLGLTSHVGSFITEIGSLGILMWLLRLPRWGWRQTGWFTALFAFVAFCTASDRLIAIQFVTPVCLTLLVGLSGPREMTPFTLTWRRVMVLGALLALATGTGQCLLRLVIPVADDRMDLYQGFRWSRLWGTGRFVLESMQIEIAKKDMLHISAACWYSLCLGYVLFRSMARITRKADRQPPASQGGLLFLSVFSLAMFCCCIGAVAYAGILYQPIHSHAWRDVYRYFFPVFLLPFFGWGIGVHFLLQAVPQRTLIPKLAPVGILLACALQVDAARALPRNHDQDMWDYYPDYVKQLDNLSESYDLRYGIGGYWESRIATLLSKKNVRVYPVHIAPDAPSAFHPFHMLSNAEWYFGAPGSLHAEPRYTFVVVDPNPDLPIPQRKTVIEKYGEPAHELPDGPFRILVYDRASDRAFQQCLQRDLRYVGLIAARHPGYRVTYQPGWLPTAICSKDRDERIAREGVNPPGPLVFGPYHYVRFAGKHRVGFSTVSDNSAGSNGDWEVVHISTKNGAVRILASGSIPPGEQRTVGEFDLTADDVTGLLEFRVLYKGTGTLALTGIDFERQH